VLVLWILGLRWRCCLTEMSNADFLQRIEDHKKVYGEAQSFLRLTLTERKRLSDLEGAGYSYASAFNKKMMRVVAMTADLRRWCR